MLLVQPSFYLASRLLCLGQQDNGERQKLKAFTEAKGSPEHLGLAKGGVHVEDIGCFDPR